MKKSKTETAQTRKRIVDVASQAFRGHGIEATGVAEIMSEVGLTHGGFYRHFESKEQLVFEAIAKSLDDLVVASQDAAKQGAEAIAKHFQNYVSPAYRDDIEHGCPLAANGSELVRADDATRHTATEAFQKIFGSLAPFIRRQKGEDGNDAAISVLTNMIGALTMSRVVDDPELSERILRVTRDRIAKMVNVPASKTSAAAAVA